MSHPVRILFVCTGNICRSPTAHAVLLRLIRERGMEGVLECDSAGTQAYHEGDGADPRSCATGERHGLDFSFHRARKVVRRDLEDFDWILAMDRSHLDWLQDISYTGQRAKVELFLSALSDSAWMEMPDPYYGGGRGFETVLSLCQKGCEAWLPIWLPQLAEPDA